MTERQEIASIPPHDRKFIAILSEPLERKSMPVIQDSAWTKWLKPLILGTSPRSDLVATAFDELVLKRSEARAPESAARPRVLIASRADTEALVFPIGHPLERTVYALHPVIPEFYMPVGDFHRTLFEHKVAEALRIVRSLGASLVRVEHISGWRDSKEAGVALALPVDGVVDAGAGIGKQTTGSRHIISEMRLRPSGRPALPLDLAWYPHEPLWVEVANARLESGLESFAIDVSYTDDYGVNADLKLGIESIGLKLAGGFKEHESTVWRVSGNFGGESPAYESSS